MRVLQSKDSLQFVSTTFVVHLHMTEQLTILRLCSWYRICCFSANLPM